MENLPGGGRPRERIPGEKPPASPPPLAETLSHQKVGGVFRQAHSDSETTAGPVSATKEFPVGWRSLLESIKHAVRGLFSRFIEYDHPWKQLKYAQALQGLSLAVDTKTSTLIDDWERKPLDAFKTNVLEIAKMLQTPAADSRQQYYSVLKKLRRALQDPDLSTQESSFKDYVQALATARYHDVHLYSFCDQLVSLVLDEGRHELRRKGVSDFAQDGSRGAITAQDFAAIGSVPQEFGATWQGVTRGRLRGTLNISFDPNMQTNVPYVLADVAVGQNNSCRLLRMGTPTIEGFVGEATVVPEFSAFLDGLETEGKQHLYISLQSPIPKAMGSEIGRHKALVAEAETKHSNTLLMCSLAQDSDFYKHPMGKDDVPSVDFRAELLRRMTQEPEVGGFYFSPALRDKLPNLNHQMERLFDAVLENVFFGSAQLSLKDRQDFIEVFYAFLSLYLVNATGVATANITCKDAIDRASKGNTLLLQLAAVVSGKEKDLEIQRVIQTTCHAPAFLVKKRPIVRKRMQRLLPVLQRFQDDRVCENIRAMGTDWWTSHDNPIQVAKTPSVGLYPPTPPRR